MGALRAYEKADAVVEGFGSLLGRGLEALADDVLRVWQSSAVWLVLAGALQTAVRIHTVHQTICRKRKKTSQTLPLLMLEC